MLSKNDFMIFSIVYTMFLRPNATEPLKDLLNKLLCKVSLVLITIAMYVFNSFHQINDVFLTFFPLF